MKNKSYIFCFIGIVLIIIAVIILIKDEGATYNNDIKNNSNLNDNTPYESNLLWNVEYQKGEFDENVLVEYDSKLYKNVVINQNRAYATNYYSYIVPSSAYFYSNLNDLVKYVDNKLSIIRRIHPLDIDNADYVDDMFDNYFSNDYLNISSYKISNGNYAYLIKTSKEHNYEQILIIYIKAENGYYKVEYHLDNQKFSNNFLNNILKDDNELIIDEKDTKDNWKLLLDLPNKKQFIMRYDDEKYQVASELLFEDYRVVFLDENKDILIVSLLYDENNDIEQSIISKYGSYYVKESEETINNYQVKIYIHHDTVDTKMYFVSLDAKTKLFIVTGSKNMDINDFLYFTYE